jgi:hypothetical protein
VIDIIDRYVQLKFVIGIAPFWERVERVLEPRLVAAVDRPDNSAVPLPQGCDVLCRARADEGGILSYSQVNVTTGLHSRIAVVEGIDRFSFQGARSKHEATVEQGVHQPAQVLQVGHISIVFRDEVMHVLHSHVPLLSMIRSHQAFLS